MAAGRKNGVEMEDKVRYTPERKCGKDRVVELKVKWQDTVIFVFHLHYARGQRLGRQLRRCSEESFHFRGQFSINRIVLSAMYRRTMRGSPNGLSYSLNRIPFKCQIVYAELIRGNLSCTFIAS
jgi:hypothetical protein